MGNFVVRPIDRKRARVLCEAHPHARTLPNTSKYYMAAYIGGKIAGLAVWGYGIMPRHTPKHLFGDAGEFDDYLELCRYFVYDWCPPNTASRFLAFTHRMIKKYAPGIKWLYTYAAGFQGMVGTIYQAANYDYIGRVLCNSFVHIPGRGLVHNIPLYLRYGRHINGSNPKSLRRLREFIPGAVRWNGYNFRYIYWLCSKREKARLMESAKFSILPYPTKNDLEIWTDDGEGNRVMLDEQFARSIPIIKLPSSGHKKSVSYAGA